MFSVRQAAFNCLRPFAARCNSTAASDGMHQLGAYVKSQLKKTPVNPSFLRNPESEFRSFTPNTFITPQRLTYESVKKGKRVNPTPPKVGPSKREARKTDPFYQLNIDPLDMAMNPAVLNDYVSDMGKIYPRAYTKLTWKSQRRLGKAIRRAKMMGIIPILSRRNIFGVYDSQSPRSW
ncbi:mitochondrial ribosomal protein s18 [Moniliophthora roreri]|nr:mitochondrial ribosomal protein s18 [Moniliophthora roreri]